MGCRLLRLAAAPAAPAAPHTQTHTTMQIITGMMIVTTTTATTIPTARPTMLVLVDGEVSAGKQ